MHPEPELLHWRGYGEAPELVLVGPRRKPLPDPQHHVERLKSQRAMLACLVVDAEDGEVERRRTRADPPAKATLGLVVELSDAVSDVKRVVVGQAGDARAQDDVLGPRQRFRDEEFRRGDILPGAGEVLADPRLPVAEAVEQDDLLHILADGLGEVRPRRVERHGEVAQFHHVLLSWGGSARAATVCQRRRAAAARTPQRSSMPAGRGRHRAPLVVGSRSDR